jgi:Cd2+/Zn2+-exporting ATPase
MILVAVGAWALGHPEEGAMLLVLFGASRAMESYARGRTHSSIADLIQELPRRATRVTGTLREDISVDDVAIGDQLLVKPGERFPVDCKFVEGQTQLDLSAITGESERIAPEPGREIPSGTINGNGLVRVQAIKRACDSAFQKVIALIENAPQRRSPAQVLSDRVGSAFTKVILVTSILAFLVWWLAAGLPIRDAAYRAMVLLVAGSPCAIVLSVPSAILAAIASGARRGILFNGGRGLASLATVRKIAFDKTGTLSTGEPGVVKIGGPGAEDAEELAVACELARCSTHPASRSVLKYFVDRGIDGESHHIEQVIEKPGRGITGIWRGREIELGRPRACDALSDLEDASYSRVVFFCDNQPRIRFYLTENPRPRAAEAVHELRQRGVASVIISGDVQHAVDRMGRALGIEDARGELRPEDKHRFISAEAGQEHGIVMVGDGVNDAPALSAATVGVAMGIRGSAATLAQADIVLVKDCLVDLVKAYDLSRFTRRVIAQNLAIAIGAAALLMAGALIGKLPLALGVFGHEGGTVLVVLNSLRLLLATGRSDGGDSQSRVPAARPSESFKPAEHLS